MSEENFSSTERDLTTEAVMENLWKEMVGPRESVGKFQHFRYAIPLVKATLGELQKNGVIKVNTVRQAVEEKVLTGKIVCSVGGHEGTIYTKMGAQVFCISPEMFQFPKVPGATFISENLDPASFLREFDLTLSNRLFDIGSGLTNASYTSHDYQNLLMGIFATTKIGGISVHTINRNIFDFNLKSKIGDIGGKLIAKKREQDVDPIYCFKVVSNPK